MSNVHDLPLPNRNWPPRELTDHERDLLVRSIQKIAADQYYPLSRLLMRLAVVVRDYPLEEVTLRDMSPTGFLISADYPTYGLHWVFRLEGHNGLRLGRPVTEVDLLTKLQEGVKGLGASMYSARFSARFLNELGDTLTLDTIDSDDKCVVVSGSIQSTPFAVGGKYQYLPFRMTLTRL